MLYLMLFAVLAVGFCAASAMSVQIARNDRLAADARGAAESGMQIARLRLGQIRLPAGISNHQLMESIGEQLGQALVPSRAPDVDRAAHDRMIRLPDAGMIPIDAGAGTGFVIQMTLGQGEVCAKSIGHCRDEAVRRAVRVRFKAVVARDGLLSFVPIAGAYEEVADE